MASSATAPAETDTPAAAVERFAVALGHYFEGPRGDGVGRGEIDRAATTDALLDALKATAQPDALDALRAQLDTLFDACEFELGRFGTAFFGRQQVAGHIDGVWMALGAALNRFDRWDALAEAAAEVAEVERLMSDARSDLARAEAGMEIHEAARLHDLIDFDLAPRLATARAHALQLDAERLAGEVDALRDVAASVRRELDEAEAAVRVASQRLRAAEARRAAAATRVSVTGTGPALQRLAQARAGRDAELQAAKDQLEAVARTLAARAIEAQRVENFKTGRGAPAIEEGQA